MRKARNAYENCSQKMPREMTFGNYMSKWDANIKDNLIKNWIP